VRSYSPSLPFHLPRKNDREIADVKFLVFVADDFLDAPSCTGFRKPQSSDTTRSPARHDLRGWRNFLSDVLFIQRTDHSAPRIHALLDADDHVARDERLRLLLNREIPALGYARAVNPCAPRPMRTTFFVAFGGNQREGAALFVRSGGSSRSSSNSGYFDRRQKLFHCFSNHAGSFFDHTRKTNGEIIWRRRYLLDQHLTVKIEARGR